MIRMYTAITSQIDDPKAAAEEILEQLGPQKNMLKNTVGIVSFYYEYAENGTYLAIADRLPFDLVGISSTFMGAHGENGEFSLTVAMLTSDDVSFSVASESTENKSLPEVTASLEKISGRFLEKERPKLILSYIAGQPNFTGDDLVSVMDKITGGIPLFGSLAFDENGAPEKKLVTVNHRVSRHLMGFIAVYGDFEPRFHVVTSLDTRNLIKEAALITEADGPVLKSVNGMPTFDYLQSIGMVKDGYTVMHSFLTIATVLLYENGTRVARALLEQSRDDQKSVVAAGNMPVGTGISFAIMDSDKTIEGAEKTVEYFEREGIVNTLNYSCAGRSWALGSRYFSELEIFTGYYERMCQKKGLPPGYVLSYSGGEFCPVPDKNGKLINCLHNYSLISCIFNTPEEFNKNE